jgi:hypothetical protein
MSTKRVKPADGKPSNKHGVFAFWLDSWLGHEPGFDEIEAHRRYPAVLQRSIHGWADAWTRYDGSEFTGKDGFPKGTAKTVEQRARIKAAIRKARRGSRTREKNSDKAAQSDEAFPEALPSTGEYVEGAVVQVTVNRYERDPDARIACLNEHGYSCDVCRMTFLACYGKIGEGFIHVHHRRPLAVRKAEYQLNPTKDLVPVCPNCHAMLHYGRPWDSPRTTEELRELTRKRRER